EHSAEGIQILLQARNLLPARMDVVYDMMLLFLRTGDRATADGLAQLVMLHAKDPRMGLQARSAINLARFTAEGTDAHRRTTTGLEGAEGRSRSSDIDSFNL